MLIAFKPLNCMSLLQIICRSNRKKVNMEYVSFVIENYNHWMKNGSKLCYTKNLERITLETNTPLKVFTSYFRLKKNGLYPPCLHPNWHEGWYFYLLVLFG